jgi:hypothetical protein
LHGTGNVCGVDLSVIQKYQELAGQGLVVPLTCPRHFIDLLPLMHDSIMLMCPHGDFRQILGIGEYNKLVKKTEMATWLDENK